MNDAKTPRQDLEAAVTDLIVETLRVPAKKMAFAARSHVDLSEFEPARHFGPEAGPNIILVLIELGRWLLTWKRPPQLVPITVADLVRAAETGKWVESRSQGTETKPL